MQFYIRPFLLDNKGEDVLLDLPANSHTCARMWVKLRSGAGPGVAGIEGVEQVVFSLLRPSRLLFGSALSFLRFSMPERVRGGQEVTNQAPARGIRRRSTCSVSFYFEERWQRS